MPDPTDHEYVVLRTCADDGTMLIHLPTTDRIESRHADYWTALDAAKALRRADYRHRGTDEIRTYSAADTDGCAWHDDQTVWRFVSAADYWHSRGYALALEVSSLPFYEPPRGRMTP